MLVVVLECFVCESLGVLGGSSVDSVTEDGERGEVYFIIAVFSPLYASFPLPL